MTAIVGEAEAESIYYIETVQRGAIFVTDDRPALDFARNRGIAVMNAAEVLHECYTHREVDCPTPTNSSRRWPHTVGVCTSQ